MKLDQIITVEPSHRGGITITITATQLNATLMVLLSTYIAERLRVLQDIEVIGRVIDRTNYFVVLPARGVMQPELYAEVRKALFASSLHARP